MTQRQATQTDPVDAPPRSTGDRFLREAVVLLEARRSAEKKQALTRILKKIREIRDEIKELKKERHEYHRLKLLHEQQTYAHVRPDYREVLKTILDKKNTVKELLSLFKRITSTDRFSAQDEREMYRLIRPVR